MSTFAGAFILGSMAYVYKLRGDARWESLSDYLRKGWPVFAPLNCLLYLFTEKRARGSQPKMADFPELSVIEENWEVIRDEAQALFERQVLEQSNTEGTAGYYDLGFHTFQKFGWRKFYLKWYGTTLNSAQKLCPKTVEILNRAPSVNGAMFSYLPGPSKLTHHTDPLACSLRYHLGLKTPNDDGCYINVDGKKISWRDGKGFLFDETHLHYVFNTTDKGRLILMGDIERPTHSLGSIVNFIYKGLARLSVVPNLPGDQRGLINRVFTALGPALNWAKNLKESNRALYLIMKNAINLSLLALAALATIGAFKLLSHLWA